MIGRILGCFVAGLACLQGACVSGPPAQPEKFVEGLHYHRLDPPIPTESADGRVEVVELFLYACSHCYDLEPKMQAWLESRSDFVDFRYLPAIVGAPWADQARAFYIGEELGMLDTSHSTLFDSIHRDGKKYDSDQSVMQFFVDQGVQPEAVVAAFNTPEVAEKVSLARVRTVEYGIRGVPAVVVNGRYVTAQYYARSQEEMIEIVDMLVDRERARTASRSGSE